ncbi:carbamoyltransferase C-terminal domain-containing protein [Dactylosporangium sp. McL0621]|uniref:carbamoyltransferase C-terminal domain-containing protein n=1 Tax=Dactylosporangium sp. McL0621 TaxID=3415678 RepID=UPI003CF98A6B
MVGWIQGPTETGPRAVGHRSILADSRTITSRDRINRNIKSRELWRAARSEHRSIALAVTSRRITRFRVPSMVWPVVAIRAGQQSHEEEAHLKA